MILVTAGITTVIFKWLKQPVVLGYIIAGFLIGPNFEWFPVINDHTSVETWSEIGMVFMLFGIGLEFSFKKLKKVGGTVGVTALTELVTMCVVGFLLGKMLGWSQMDCIFLGAMLSISSTTIIAKAIGCTLPLLAKKVGLDPALMASPIITTLVDACSLSILFSIAAVAL